jgi:uncharacterized protein YqcC (DUF446 family)
MHVLYRDIARLLRAVELEMQALALWSEELPDPEALRSDQPFCVDTLSFAQWLQHVFVPTLDRLIQHTQPLPERCDVAPMAEVVVAELTARSDGSAAELLGLLRQIDASLSAPRD